jgi:hypothetical protein
MTGITENADNVAATSARIPNAMWKLLGAEQRAGCDLWIGVEVAATLDEGVPLHLA